MKIRNNILCLAVTGLFVAGCSNNTNNLPEKKDDVVDVPIISKSGHPIINGIKDTMKIHRGVVSLYLPDYNWSICTGTLIHPKWVLTAAHCVAVFDDDGKPVASEDNSILKIAVGDNLDQLKLNQYDIANIYFHDKYEMVINVFDDDDGKEKEDITIQNDIALIELAEKIPESVAYPIPPLTPEEGITKNEIETNGVPVTLVGFGKDENNNSGVKLRYDIKLFSYCGASDNDNINGCYLGSVIVNGCHPDKSMCDDEQYSEWCKTGYACMDHYKYQVITPYGSLCYLHDPGGTCNGDSGGPMLINTPDFPWIAVVGVTSYGDPACAKVSVNTSVQDFYNSFILKYAPEVKTYHDDKFKAMNDEFASGICGETLLEYCNGYHFTKNGNACYLTDDKKSLICTELCDEENSLHSYCEKNSEGKYHTIKNRCQNFNGNLMWVRDDSLTEICEDGCNENKTGCYVDNAEIAWENEITSGICGEQHLKKCDENYNDTYSACYFPQEGKPDYICTFVCNNESQTWDQCSMIDGQMTYHQTKCKNVHGTMMMVRDFTNAETCADGCDGDVCKKIPESQIAWNNEIKSGVCGPEHVKKCKEIKDLYDACYFLNEKGQYQCTYSCSKELLNKTVGTSCSRVLDDYEVFYTECVDKGSGPVYYTNPDRTERCEFGCSEDKLSCKTYKSRIYEETFEGMSDKIDWQTAFFDSPNTGTKWTLYANTYYTYDKIDGQGVQLAGLREDGTHQSYISGYAHEGIEDITVDALPGAPFEGKNFILELQVNGKACATVTLKPEQKVQAISCEHVDLSGDVEIRLINKSANNTSYITIDNILWTSY